MDWTLEFYRKQHQWTNAYRGRPGEHEQEKIERIRARAGDPPLDVLELGSGGGQFAVAGARSGYRVVAVELVPELAADIEKLGEDIAPGFLEVINEDFYKVELEKNFDIICYWDGFGIGEDKDQQKILKRMGSWLKPGGTVLLDIYAPWHWAREAGKEREFGDLIRRTDFDYRECRFLDSFWPRGKKKEAITQSLRCYTITDLKLLLAGTGLKLTGIDTVEGFDRETGEFSTGVDFKDAMMYGVILKKH